MNSVTAQRPFQNTVEYDIILPLLLFRPRLATTHSVLIWRAFFFLFSVWWWRERGRVSHKGETDGILVSI